MQILILSIILVSLDVQANLRETSPFFVCPNYQMALVSTFCSNIYSTWHVKLCVELEYSFDKNGNSPSEITLTH